MASVIAGRLLCPPTHCDKPKPAMRPISRRFLTRIQYLNPLKIQLNPLGQGAIALHSDRLVSARTRKSQPSTTRPVFRQRAGHRQRGGRPRRRARRVSAAKVARKSRGNCSSCKPRSEGATIAWLAGRDHVSESTMTSLATPQAGFRKAAVRTTNGKREALETAFLGLGQRDAVIALDGTLGERRRVYLDSAATTLMARDVHEALTRYLETSCANSHTHAHRAGRATTNAIDRARQAVGSLVGLRPGDRLGVVHRQRRDRRAELSLARAVSTRAQTLPQDQRPAGLGPPRERVPGAAPTGTAVLARRAPARGDERDGAPLEPLTVGGGRRPRQLPLRRGHQRGPARPRRSQARARQEGSRCAWSPIAGVSNVTGVRNPVHEIAGLAHAVGAEIAVDAAQMGAHARLALHARERRPNRSTTWRSPGTRCTRRARVARSSESCPHAVGAQCVGRRRRGNGRKRIDRRLRAEG